MRAVIVMVLAVVALTGCGPEPEIVYDVNDPIYKFIPEAGNDWKETFGDTDDTRMKHTVSELRVVVANISQRLLILEADPNDPNEVK